MLLRVEFMKRVPLFLVLFLLLRPHAFATWSVLAVSQTRGSVVIASATCLALEPPQTLMKIQAVVVPGKGVAAAQALLDPSGANQKLIFEELKKGTPPDEILRATPTSKCGSSLSSISKDALRLLAGAGPMQCPQASKVRFLRRKSFFRFKATF
jgi:hypothetical protein